jgi:acyl-CoA hydrolase
VRDRIEPATDEEAELAERARIRRAERLERFARKTTERSLESDGDEDVRWRFESVRSVLPEDALFGNVMFPGKMLMDIDEAGGILSMRYCRGFLMTACLDAMDFYAPIFTHEVLIFKAALNHVGTSSLEVGVKVLAETPWTGEARHACTAFLTYVHLVPSADGTLRPAPCPPYTPETPAERRRWQEALVRRDRRLERVKRLKAALQSAA